MSFDVPPQLAVLLEQLRAFMRQKVLPLEPAFLNGPYAELQPRLTALREEVRRQGWFSPHLAREHGGLGLPLTQFARVSEEIGRSPLGMYLFNAQAPDVGNMELLLEVASEAQRAQFLAPLMRGDIRSCFTMTEPEFAGSNPTTLGTTAVRDGDHYVLNGHKWFSSAADGAAFAIAMVVTNPSAERPHERASLILVPTDTPGFRIVRNISVMGHPGSDYFSHSEVRYENCRVPVQNLLGQENQGFKLAQRRLGPGRIHHCMRWIGVAERALELLIERAASREIAPGQRLSERQSVQFWMAESRAEIDAARLLVLSAAEKIERQGAERSRTEISIIKFFVPDVMLRVVDRAIQVHGALGITDDAILSWWYRHERGARIYDGPDEVHKEVVARHLLRRHAEAKS